MKKISLLVILVMIVSLIGCQNNSSEDEYEKTSISDTNQIQANSTNNILNIEEVWTRLASDYPNATAEELCELMIENPFFKLFTISSTEYDFPGMKDNFKPEGIKEASCIIEFVSGSGSVVYVITIDEGTDADIVIDEMKNHADYKWQSWADESMTPDCVTGKYIDGKVFFAMYRSDLKPIETKVAEKARDLVDIFNDYVNEHKNAPCIDIAEHLSSNQKFVLMTASNVDEGYIEGFDNPISGFSDGAWLSPIISPTPFIGYVFKISDKTDSDSFEQLLNKDANLVWNICISADTIIIEKNGDYILFIMCSEYN